MVKNLPAMGEIWVWERYPPSLSPGEGNGPVFLTGEFHGQRSLAGYLLSMGSK